MFARKWAHDDRFFENIDTEAKAYWLGFASADATVSSRRLRFVLKEKDAAHLEKFRADVQFTGPVQWRTQRASFPNGQTGIYRQPVVTINGYSLPRALSRLGVGPRKSLTLRPWCGPADLMRHYWRGLVDGDGCLRIYISPGRTLPRGVVNLVGSRWVVQGFSDFVFLAIGHRCQPRRQENIWAVDYRGAGLPRKVATLLYADATVFLARKQVLAATMMAQSSSIRSWKYLTAEQVVQWKAEYGTWQAVTDAIGIEGKQLWGYRKKFGLA